MVFRALLGGFRRVSVNKRSVLWIFLAVWIPSTLAVSPIATLLDRSLEDRLAANQLAEEGVNMALLVDIAMDARGQIPIAFKNVLPTLGFAWLLALFLSGGVIASVLEPAGYSSERFWSGAVRAFPRFLRMLAWSLLLLVVMGILVKLPGFVADLLSDGDPPRDLDGQHKLASLIILVSSLLFYRTVIDYARVSIVRLEQTNTRRALWGALRLTVRRLPTTVGYSVAMVLIAGLVGALTFKILGSIAPRSTALATTLLIVQQLYMVWRAIWRVARYGGTACIHEQFVAANSGTTAVDLPAPPLGGVEVQARPLLDDGPTVFEAGQNTSQAEDQDADRGAPAPSLTDLAPEVEESVVTDTSPEGTEGDEFVDPERSLPWESSTE